MKQMKQILTTADIVEMTGWKIQRVQALCRSGQLPAKDVSLGGRKNRWLIRLCDWEEFCKPNNAPAERQKRVKRQRIDSHIENPVFG